MSELIGEFTLRNSRKIYRKGNNYIVEQTDRNGTRYTVDVSHSLAKSLALELTGHTVTKNQAADALKLIPGDKPYDYGYKLDFYAQDVLLVLVSLDMADFEKIGRGYQYTIY